MKQRADGKETYTGEPMNNLKHNELIEKINQELKERYEEFLGMYFFGSRMRQNFSEDSDFDILLIFDREIDYPFKREVRDILYDYMLQYDVVIDAKIFSLDEVKYPEMPFVQEVKQNGLYYGV